MIRYTESNYYKTIPEDFDKWLKWNIKKKNP